MLVFTCQIVLYFPKYSCKLFSINVFYLSKPNVWQHGLSYPVQFLLVKQEASFTTDKLYRVFLMTLIRNENFKMHYATPVCDTNCRTDYTKYTFVVDLISRIIKYECISDWAEKTWDPLHWQKQAHLSLSINAPRLSDPLLPFETYRQVSNISRSLVSN